MTETTTSVASEAHIHSSDWKGLRSLFLFYPKSVGKSHSGRKKPDFKNEFQLKMSLEVHPQEQININTDIKHINE